MQFFSLFMQIAIYINGKTVIYIAMRTTVRIPNSKVASYIANN